MNFEINVCPECGGKIKTVLHNGITLKECMSCDFSINMTTGKVEHHNLPKHSMIVLCPKCGGKHRIAADQKLSSVECSFCYTKFTRPSVPDQNIDMIVTCPECNAKNRVKANRGKLLVTCNKCGKQFPYDSGVSKIPGMENAQSQPKEQDKKVAGSEKNIPSSTVQAPPASQPSSHPKREKKILPKRKLYFYWNGSAAQTLNKLGLFNSSKSAEVFVDGISYGSIDEELVVETTCNKPHNVYASAKLLGSIKSKMNEIQIPADSNDYVCFVFQESGGAHKVVAAPCGDTFVLGIVAFVEDMFKKKGVLDRMTAKNNSSNSIRLDIWADHIEISWGVTHASNLKQWATGEDSEKIYYRNIGLTPPSPNAAATINLWQAIKMLAIDKINENERFDANYSGNIYLRTKSNLY